jgi:hypothetical protein
MNSLTIVISFDVSQQIVPGSRPGWAASLMREFGFDCLSARGSDCGRHVRGHLKLWAWFTTCLFWVTQTIGVLSVAIFRNRAVGNGRDTAISGRHGRDFGEASMAAKRQLLPLDGETRSKRFRPFADVRLRVLDGRGCGKL